jgi:sortase (surface protein transpeptidase)
MGEERERVLRVIARHFLAVARTPPAKFSGIRRRPSALALLAGVALLAGAGMALAGRLPWWPAARPPAIAVAAQPPAAGNAAWPGGAAAHPSGANGANGANSAAALPPAPPMSFSVPVRVAVPSIGVSAPVIPLGANPDGTVAVPSLATPQLTSWFDEGPAPGQQGPAAIYGHVDTAAAGPAVFYRLGDLVSGDVADVIRADGGVARFQVYRVAEYAKDAFPTVAVYGATRNPELRLITCGGVFDAATGSYLDNIVVYARLVR